MRRIDAPRLAARAGRRPAPTRWRRSRGVAEVRGTGLLLAAELDDGRDAKAVYADLLERGLVDQRGHADRAALRPAAHRVATSEIDEAVAMIAAASLA